MIRQDRRIYHPGLMVVAVFGILIGVGTVLLRLPLSHERGAVSLADCLFTSTSAVTVTGLAVVDTGTSWTPFGEVVIMVLMQLGGLGVLTMAGFFGIALNRRLGVRSGLLAGAEMGLSDLGVLATLIRDLVRFVVATEVVATALLMGRFYAEGEHSVLQAFHLAAFHTVAAFNNAGFSTFPTSLETRAGDWFTNLVIAGTFILGGIGFPVVFEVRRRWRQPSTWTLHTKVTIVTTIILLVAGTVALAVLEWTNPATIGGMPLDEKILASFFQSATTRTAGFNSVPIGALRPASLLVMILLMVIGTGSASTGGGIKVSTFAVVVRSTLSELRGDPVATMFGRQLSMAHQIQALSLVVAALATVGTTTFLLAAIQPEIPAIELLYEAASAFGTVGTSTGVTTELEGPGRLILIGLMFVGRVSPITFGTAMLLRGERRLYGYAEEELIVG